MRAFKKYLLFILLFATSATTFAQINKAHRLYERGAFSQAARLYEEILKIDSNQITAVINLAHCYRHEKDYRAAKPLFKKAASLNSHQSEQSYHFAQMLFLLGEFDRAHEQVQARLLAEPDHADFQKLRDRIKVVRSYPANDDFVVVSLKGINSPYADFGPVLHNNELVFTSERPNNRNVQIPAVEEKPFTSVYAASFSADQSKSFDSPVPFGTPVNHRYHDGPMSFSSSGNTVYFTRVDRQQTARGKTNRLKIYIAHRDGENWTRPEPLPFNSNDYSVAHPVVAENDSVLIFSSDMPGGFGGMDLYGTRFINGKWSTPENLGPKINSPGDEVFPHSYNEKLYFSSNGWPGFGGLDLFVTDLKEPFDSPQNLYTPINSAWDDLSLFFRSDDFAYFASDRPGGAGRDDLYALERKSPENTFVEISGLLKFHNRPAAFTSLLLKDEQGKVWQQTVTDALGSFTLRNMQPNVSYSLLLDITDKSQLEHFTVYFLNDRHEKVQKILPSESGDFIFELLPPDDHDNLALIEAEDPGLLLIDLRGTVFRDEPGDVISRIEIQIFNSAGELIGRNWVENDGQFVFHQLIPDDQYIFRLLIDDESLRIVIYDDQGKELARLSRTGLEYIYNRFAPGDPVLSLLNERNVSIKVSPDDKFSLPNIYYEFDSWQLNEHSSNQLDRLYEILVKNPKTAIKIMSHTDSRASDAYNLELSEKRAAGVVSYLRNKGLAASRLSGKGYGEQQLVNHCKNDVPCSEAEHAMNRRTEFTLYSVEE